MIVMQGEADLFEIGDGAGFERFLASLGDGQVKTNPDGDGEQEEHDQNAVPGFHQMRPFLINGLTKLEDMLFFVGGGKTF